MCLSFQKQKRNTYNAYVLCLSTSRNTIWSSSQPSVSSSRVRSTIWLIMSPRKVYILARRTRKLWLGSLHPQTCIAIWAFWAWWDITNDLSRGSHALCNHHTSHLFGEGPGKKSQHVMLTEDVLGTFKMLKKACLEAPVLAFPDFSKPFLLETDVSKLGMGAVLSQKQTDGQYHPLAYTSWLLTVHEHNYH